MRPSRAAEIAERLARRIEAGELEAGSRLASLRAAAGELGVAKNTVVEAYRRLVASGHLEARQGAGFFVRGAAAAADGAGPLAPALDLPGLLGAQLAPPRGLPLGDEAPPAEWLAPLGPALAALGDAAARIAAAGRDGAAGHEPLRQLLAERLAGRGVRLPPEQLLLTFGANHALDLIVRLGVEPGDGVLADSPGYPPLLAKLRLAGASVAGVRRGPEGPDLADFEAKARALRPRLFFTQTLAHNPTGGSVGEEDQRRLLELAAHYGVTLVEDDPFGDLLPPETPRLAALGGPERAIYVGSFSKTLAPGLRLGYLAGSAPLVRRLSELKAASLGGGAGVAERLVHALLAGGQYARHLAGLRERVARAAAAALEGLRGLGFEVQGGAGGYYLWCLLPDDADEAALARAAARERLFLAPGSLFAVPGDYRAAPALRLHVAHAVEPAFLDFMARVRRGEAAG